MDGEGLLAGFGKGIEAGIKGYMDADDRLYRRKEAEAKRKAAATEEERKSLETEVNAYKAGLIATKDPTGKITGFAQGQERPTSPKDQAIIDYYRKKTEAIGKPGGEGGLTPYQNYQIKAKEEERMDKAAERLASKAKPMQDILGTVQTLEKKLGFKLGDYDEATGEYRDAKTGKMKKLDLPGVNLPGIGRTTFYSGAARDLQATMSKIFNVELKTRSGAAVTDPELNRLKDEFASGKFNTEEEMIKAIKDFTRAAHRALINAESGFNKDVQGLYRGRGGQTSQDFQGLLEPSPRGLIEPAPAAPPAPQGLVPTQTPAPQAAPVAAQAPQSKLSPAQETYKAQGLKLLEKYKNDPATQEIIKQRMRSQGVL